MNDFLDHIVRNESDIMFIVLNTMITSIFAETSIEFTVLVNANRSANQLSISSFDNIGLDVSHGLLFRQKQCSICHKNLDEDVKAAQKRDEM
jgi:hypothetical protein